MGIAVELPAQMKKTAVESHDTSKGPKEVGNEAWQWGPFESLPIDDAISHPTRLPQTPADALVDSPDSSKSLISPSITGSSSPSSSSSPHSHSAPSPPFSGGCADPFGGKAAAHRKLKKRGKGKGLSFACNDDFQPSRWDSGRWSAGGSFNESSTRPRGIRACKCAAGLTADVAAVCCCPFSLLHLLAIAFIKLPSAVVSKTVTRVRRKIVTKRRRAAVHEEDDESVPASSFPPSRSRSYEEGEIQTWAPALAFGDQKMWRDYFDSPDTGIWNSEELLRAKS